MKKTRFKETQSVSILMHQEVAISTKEVCCEYSISTARFYNWKSKYSGIETSNAEVTQALSASEIEKQYLLYAAK